MEYYIIKLFSTFVKRKVKSNSANTPRLENCCGWNNWMKNVYKMLTEVSVIYHWIKLMVVTCKIWLKWILFLVISMSTKCNTDAEKGNLFMLGVRFWLSMTDTLSHCYKLNVYQIEFSEIQISLLRFSVGFV